MRGLVLRWLICALSGWGTWLLLSQERLQIISTNVVGYHQYRIEFWQSNVLFRASEIPFLGSRTQELSVALFGLPAGQYELRVLAGGKDMLTTNSLGQIVTNFALWSDPTIVGVRKVLAPTGGGFILEQRTTNLTTWTDGNVVGVWAEDKTNAWRFMRTKIVTPTSPPAPPLP